MNIFQAEIEQLKTALAAALPGVRVNGSLIEHEELRRDELLQGVVTVLLEVRSSPCRAPWRSPCQ